MLGAYANFRPPTGDPTAGDLVSSQPVTNFMIKCNVISPKATGVTK
jgi:hypothetical protein